MNIGRSGNPALNKNTFAATGAFAGTESEVMTINGTVNKIFIMLLLVIGGASYVWNKFFSAYDMQQGIAAVQPWLIGGGIGGFIVAIITVFKQSWARITAPIYALLEGVFLGGLSAIFEAQFQGIVIQAVGLTFGVLFVLLLAYRSGWIKVTQNFRLGVVAATGGIALFYLVSFILGMFGVNTGYLHGTSLLSIGISVVIVIVAALNLVLDFDFIESGAEQGAPKHMEWYAAFGLMVTLIWLYIELLRLLSKLASRD
jgi:uncharacterized YccA/Bax inhibitor family protein